MKIAIIGNGKMAAGIGRRLAARGEPLTIGSRDSAKGRALAATLGPRISSAGLKEAAQSSELIVLAVPYTSAFDAVAEAGDLSGKILVDICNPVTPDYLGMTVGFTTSAAEEIQKRVPMAKVVKAFNTIFAEILGKPAEATSAVQVFYAADDKRAGQAAAELIGKTGFQAVFAGPLSNSRYLEPVGELNIHFGFALGHGTHTAPAWVKL